jgi:hypothetical protein
MRGSSATVADLEGTGSRFGDPKRLLHFQFYTAVVGGGLRSRRLIGGAFLAGEGHRVPRAERSLLASARGRVAHAAFVDELSR